MSVFGEISNVLMRKTHGAIPVLSPASVPALWSARPFRPPTTAGPPDRRRALYMWRVRLWSGHNSRRSPMERAESTSSPGHDRACELLGRAVHAGVSVEVIPVARNASDGRSVRRARTGSAGTSEQAESSRLPPAAAFYLNGLGWPIAFHGNEIVLQCGEVVEALAMPIGLAAEVNHLLSMHRVAAPIMEVRGQRQKRNTWVFFCVGGSLSTKSGTISVLSLHDVVHFGAGKNVLLPPSPMTDGPALRWVVEPRLDTPLPHWASLVSCVLTVIKR